MPKAKQTTDETDQAIVLCGAALNLDNSVPEWIHLLPASGLVETGDDRGPYHVGDLQQIKKASIGSGKNAKLVIDENHSTDLAAPQGRSAPARGWIVELQERENGLWGRVEWTEAGEAMVASKEYRGISPVISHSKEGGEIQRILRASLVNDPNFTELTALHAKENPMDFMKKIAKTMGLGEDADEAAVLAAIGKMAKMAKMGKGDKSEKAAMSAEVVTQAATREALVPLAEALGVEVVEGEDFDVAAMATTIGKLKDGANDDTELTALQSELAGTVKAMQSMQEERKREKAVGFVDEAITEGRVGVKPERGTYITMHMENAERTEALVEAMPVVTSRMAFDASSTDGEISDPHELALQAANYQKKCREAGREIDFVAAVKAVNEGNAK